MIRRIALFVFKRLPPNVQLELALFGISQNGLTVRHQTPAEVLFRDEGLRVMREIERARRAFSRSPRVH